MTAIDYTIIVLLLFFALLSYSKGIVTELVFISKWLFSFIGARSLYGPFSDLVLGSMQNLWLKQKLGFGLFFIVFYLIFNFLGRGINRIVRSLGLDGVNHFLGIIFGALKGSVVVMVLILVVSYTSIVDLPVWKNSVLLPYFNELIMKISPFVLDRLKIGST